MKTELQYDKTNNLMHQKLHGHCSMQNLAEVFDEMKQLEPTPGLKIITDITDANLKDTDYKSLYFLEKKLDEFLDTYLPIRKAIIVESDLEFGIARTYEMLAEKEGFDVRVFRDRSEALEWLQ